RRWATHIHGTVHHDVCSFFFSRDGDPRDLHSFPTRRSSDLKLIAPDDEGHDNIEGSDKLFAAIKTIIVADLVMSVDNVIAIAGADRKSTRLNSSHVKISYAVFCLKKKKKQHTYNTQT